MTKSVLVIDDDPGLQELLRDILEEEGLDVFIASDGPAALEMLETLKPNFMIVDYMMPIMDGMAFVREAEHRGLRNTIPLIFTSANNQGVALSQEVNSDAFLRKPFDITELLAIIAPYLE